MPNELTIPSTLPAVTPAGAKPAAPAVAAERAPVPTFTNPSLRLDSALGLVVIEFRNETGAVTQSIPSAQQIEAYKMHEEAPPSPNDPPA